MEILIYFFRLALFDENTGHVKKAGEEYKLLKLAETMKIISDEGADALYNGSLTHGLVEDLKKVNGIITEEDLANYELVSIYIFQLTLSKSIFGTEIF